MAIIKSQNYESTNVLKLIEEIKWALKYGIVKSSEQAYWQELR